MRREIDEHRTAINENTTEVQTNFDFLCELDNRINHLQDRIDELFLVVSGKTRRESFAVSPLNTREKAVFWAILSLTESFTYVTYAQIATHLNTSTSVVGSYVARLVEKGVPFVKKVKKGKIGIALHPRFRQLQIQKNIVGLEVPLTRWM
ncbi:hypothetical protein GF342_02635 [Candidatus Woesearchaeota archaeon]|nr:hypothetical protein [Candidatus Woesearchaeota archaeon]